MNSTGEATDGPDAIRSKSIRPVIVWFRNDLRLADQPALRAAADSGAPVLCIYVFDTDSQGLRLPGGASRWWLHHSLAALDAGLHKAGSQLHCLRGAAAEQIPALVRAADAGAVYWTRRYDAAGIAVDAGIKKTLTAAGVEARSFNANLLVEPWDIATKAGKPYGVFTPFWKAVCAGPDPAHPLPPVTTLAAAEWPRNAPGTVWLDSLALLPSRPDWAGGLRERWSPGEAGARGRLKSFLDGALKDYAAERDRPDRASTSCLSPHLAFGEISPRTVWHATRHAAAARPGLARDAEKFLSEIGWREFSYHLLFHNPELAEKNYNARFDRFPWKTPARQHRRAWRQGRTGIPIVDAGMRELWQSGYMHNRVRMIAASFLVKNMLVDWREGERWFWDTLCDADPASNAASWQWVAGSGADAAPYFRIFNPVLQAEKFDPAGDYVRRHVPELRGLPDKYIHRPWDAPREIMDQDAKRYPAPLVDLRQSRERALAAFHATGGGGSRPE